MLILVETSNGYAAFELLQEEKIKDSENLSREFENPESAKKIVELKMFYPFGDTESDQACVQSEEGGQLSDLLRNVLREIREEDPTEQLAVTDPKLASQITEEFSIPCISNFHMQELVRCIQSQLDNLVWEAESPMDVSPAKSAHEAPNKLIIRAISKFDVVDRQLSFSQKRAKKLYSCHFPELSSLVAEDETFFKTVVKLGNRQNAASADLSDILPAELEAKVKEAVITSKGKDMSEENFNIIMPLCNEIVKNMKYRTQLHDDIKKRMTDVAPNLTVLAGEIVGARLIARTGSVMKLANVASCTVEKLGDEMAFVRACSASQSILKHEGICHASFETSPQLVERVSHMLATKCSLCARVDALGGRKGGVGDEEKADLESKIKEMESRVVP